jgi:hypothetical protein
VLGKSVAQGLDPAVIPSIPVDNFPVLRKHEEVRRLRQPGGEVGQRVALRFRWNFSARCVLDERRIGPSRTMASHG